MLQVIINKSFFTFNYIDFRVLHFFIEQNFFQERVPVKDQPLDRFPEDHPAEYVDGIAEHGMDAVILSEDERYHALAEHDNHDAHHQQYVVPAFELPEFGLFQHFSFLEMTPDGLHERFHHETHVIGITTENFEVDVGVAACRRDRIVEVFLEIVAKLAFIQTGRIVRIEVRMDAVTVNLQVDADLLRRGSGHGRWFGILGVLVV